MSRTRRAALAGAVALLAVLPGGAAGSGASRAHPGGPPGTVGVVVVRAVGPHRAQLATGVVVGDGLVLTVAHVLGDATEIQVDSRAACAVVVDRERDAAVVAVTGLRTPSVGLAESAAPGDAWLARPRHGSGSAPAPAEVSPAGIRRRIVARVHEPDGAATHERAALELETHVAAGDSGAPVLDARARLVGMVFAVSRERQNTSYGVAVDELAPLLDAATTRSCR